MVTLHVDFKTNPGLGRCWHPPGGYFQPLVTSYCTIGDRGYSAEGDSSKKVTHS